VQALFWLRQEDAPAYFVGLSDDLSRNRVRRFASLASAWLLRMKILTFTTVYPNPSEPALGTFVRKRIQAISKRADVKVIAPIPMVNYQRRALRLRRHFPRRRLDGTVEVTAPRWLYPPAGGALNALCLFISTVLLVAKLRKNYRFDVIDAHFAHPDGVAAALIARTLGCPFTITMRGNEQDHAMHWLRARWMGWTLRRAGRIIVVAKPLHDLALQLGVDPSRIVTIPNGIDTEIFHPRDRQLIRSQFGIPPSSKLVLSAGNLIELKCHRNTIQAVRSLTDSGMDVTLLIAGGSGSGLSCESALRAQVAKSNLEDRVRFLGQVSPEDLASLMCAADLFCLASSREGWPNVVHESLACGTPVVATQVGGTPEMIPSDKYGLLVPRNDVSALTDALRKALSITWDREQIAKWGQQRSWDQVAIEVIREMEAVVAEAK
jgi:teichuronic acid biosynthesis glycosyltransferase TuaC